MELRLIRNATLRIRYGGIHALIDPMLGVRNSTRPLAGVPRRNPTVDLPCPIDEVVAEVDVVVVSHLHPDHFDEAAIGVVPRATPVLCQPGDEAKLTDLGFEQVVALTEPTDWDGVEITPTVGAHGTGAVAERMGHVTGFVLRAHEEPTIYWAGDTILYEPVLDVIERERPDLIITHSGGAVVEGTPIIMDAADTVEVARAAPWATVVAVHLEAMAHCPVSRRDVRAAADDAGVDPSRLLVPADGETVSLGRETQPQPA